MQIQLGLEGKDKITGFRGIITAKVQYLYGCDQYCLVPKADKNGKMGEGSYFDEGRIEIIGKGVNPKEVQVKKPGGINRDAPSR